MDVHIAHNCGLSHDDQCSPECHLDYRLAPDDRNETPLALIESP